MEPYTLIEASGILLGLYVDELGIEMTDSCLYGMEHDFTSIALATLCGDDTANGPQTPRYAP